jgi:electron transport complex protein RnfD
MAEQKFIVSSSPHQRTGNDVQRIMFDVIIALIPAAVAAVIFFGIHAFLVMAIAVVAAMATEAACQKLMGRPVRIKDGSAAVTGLLFAMTVPPDLPLWTTVIGAAVAIGLGKQIFGGLGFNNFNPAHVGRAFLLASYPVLMTTWRWPTIGNEGIDALTTATPLALWKLHGIATPLWKLLIGNVGGSIGETSAIALILGGLYLFKKGVIDWRIPGSYIATVFILTLIIPGQNPVFHLFAGGLMIGAIFMATDYVTSPVTKRGRIIFGIGCGILTVVIRLFGGYPEGVCYSILLMNAATPLIDRYTMPRRFGEVKA